MWTSDLYEERGDKVRQVHPRLSNINSQSSRSLYIKIVYSDFKTFKQTNRQTEKQKIASFQSKSYLFLHIYSSSSIIDRPVCMVK